MSAFLLTAAALAAAPAEASSFRGEYDISILGLTIARSTFSSSFRGETFKVDGTVAAAGLATLFDSTNGTTTVSGRIAGDTLRPDRFGANYTSGRKAQKIGIRFKGGNVTETTIVPPPRKRANWVPLRAGDLNRVHDPLSATLVRAGDAGEVCRRSARVYDGELRLDLTLTPHSSGEISVPGYSGAVVTCSVRFTPVSGYRKGRKALDYLKNRSKITVSFAPLGETGVYAPIHATVGTQIGTLTVTARRFEALD